MMRRTLCALALALVLALGCRAFAGVIHNPPPTDPPSAEGEILVPPSADGEIPNPPGVDGDITNPPVADLLLALYALL